MPFATIEEAAELYRRGEVVIIVDDEDRENEGDLCLAADKVTPEAINFMARYGRGLICLALTEERTYCVPDDIKRLVVPVFAHRLTVSSRYSSAMRRSEEAETVLHEILKTISVPL